ncbi:MAG: hypothetical protein AABW75_00890 [Nanoarchaeota archaeon]
MGNMTLSIPENLLQKMKQFREIKWSEIARQAIERRINDLETVEKIAQKSKLTQNDVEEISNLIKNSLAKRLRLK